MRKLLVIGAGRFKAIAALALTMVLVPAAMASATEISLATQTVTTNQIYTWDFAGALPNMYEVSLEFVTFDGRTNTFPVTVSEQLPPANLAPAGYQCVPIAGPGPDSLSGGGCRAFDISAPAPASGEWDEFLAQFTWSYDTSALPGFSNGGSANNIRVFSSTTGDITQIDANGQSSYFDASNPSGCTSCFEPDGTPSTLSPFELFLRLFFLHLLQFLNSLLNPGISDPGVSSIEDSDDIQGIYVNTSTTPEPGTLVLLGSGVIGVLAARRRMLKSA